MRREREHTCPLYEARTLHMGLKLREGCYTWSGIFYQATYSLPRVEGSRQRFGICKCIEDWLQRERDVPFPWQMTALLFTAVVLQ